VEGVITVNRLLDITINEAVHGRADNRQYRYEPTFLLRGLRNYTSSSFPPDQKPGEHSAPLVHHDALMDQSAAALAFAIGARVKHERKSRRWTLDQLAEAAGVSRRMVVNVEQGTVNPSVGTLLRISDALGIVLPALVEPPQPRQMKVTRHGDGATLWCSESGGRGVLVAGSTQPARFSLAVLEPGVGAQARSEVVDD
jgi:DNA-binding XRE family transcriptional regulator